MAHLLIIELPGGNDADIIQSAVDRGDEFTFLSADLGHYRSQPGIAGLIAKAREQIETPAFAYEDVEGRILSAHARNPFDAVLCLIDTRLIEAARLARRLGLRFLNPESAELLRDKFEVRRRLSLRGIRQPPFKLAESNQSLREAVERLGLPVLIKPCDGYGSQNIVALRFPEDLDPLMSPLEGFLPSRVDYGLGAKANDRLLVERFLTGQVVGCDTLTENGMHRLLGVNEKIFFDPPSFAIRGGCFTPNGPRFESIERYVFSILDAVGFDWGAAHTELILTDKGPFLIEINPRLVGAKIPRLIGLALDRSLHADLIALHAGEAPARAPQALGRVAVTRWVVAGSAGVLDRVHLASSSDPRIRSVEILKHPGDPVRIPMENSDRIGYVMVCDSERAAAEELAERFVSQTHCQLATSPQSAGYISSVLPPDGTP